MIEAAEDLLHTLTSGERALPRDLYDACALAFGTTRDDAKRRITAAMYGKKGESPDPPAIVKRRKELLEDGSDPVKRRGTLLADSALLLVRGSSNLGARIERPNELEAREAVTYLTQAIIMLAAHVPAPRDLIARVIAVLDESNVEEWRENVLRKDGR